MSQFTRKEGNQFGKNPINFTTEVPEQNEIDEAINSQFNINISKENKQKDERALLKSMNGRNHERNDIRVSKNQGRELSRDEKK